MSLLDLVLAIGLFVVSIITIALYRMYLSEKKARQQKASKAWQIGVSQTIGDYSQILGTFSVLTEYDSLIMLSSTSAQSSLDLLGLKGNQLDFLEFKKDGTSLTKPERRLRQLIENGELKVSYRVLDVRLPEGSQVRERQPK
ncbi:MAG: hypothetical protein JRN20_09375 [Nitrososphaerota archaeon]|nr:hypothetical protein [Nitrososphaerota archaeon]MDG6923346.1 hypothetical protein [Nitrososphaerota archaeon]